MATDYELTLPDYLSIMRRRAPYLIGAFIVVLLAVIVVAIVIPPTYLASGTILVESQQVPDNIVPSEAKNQLDERISVIKQRVLTRDSLLQIANKYDLFKDSARFLTSSELIERMRDRVSVELINVDSIQSSRQGKSTIAFTLSFEDKSPEIAFRVTHDLVALFLDWSVKLRTARANETAIFVSQESDKLKLEVDRLEGLVSAHKQQHSDALPEQLNMRMAILERRESELREVERDIRSVKEGKTGIDQSQSLPALKADLARLSGIYSESHPDIKTLKRKIEAMEAANPESQNSPDMAPLGTHKIQASLDSSSGQMESLVQRQKMLQGKIAQNERAIALMPKVEQGLAVLIRDRDSAQKKYEEILNKKMSAQIAESLEIDNKSEHFNLLEPPILPDKPFKPDRVKIIALGFFLALASAGGMFMAMIMFDGQIRGADALAHVLGYRPLAVIPYLVIEEEEMRRKRMLKSAIITSVLAVILIALALHFFYMPLSDLFTKILARLV